MRKGVSLSGLLLAWLLANGALLDVVQIFAWGRMFAGYAQTMSVTSALKETFDPAKPCHLCVTVSETKKAEQRQTPVPAEQMAQKIVLICEEAATSVPQGPQEAWPAALAARALVRSDAVPVPPPRV